MCSGCGKRVDDIHEICESEVRDLSVFQFRTTIVIELYIGSVPAKRSKDRASRSASEQGAVQQTL